MCGLRLTFIHPAARQKTRESSSWTSMGFPANIYATAFRLFQLPFGIITQYYLQYNSYWSQLFSVNDPHLSLKESWPYLDNFGPSLDNFGPSLNIPSSNWLRTYVLRPHMACRTFLPLLSVCQWGHLFCMISLNFRLALTGPFFSICFTVPYSIK